MAQTWTRKEIIVVDDGSRDGTLALAQSFIRHGVRVFSQSNRGASAARNRAFQESSGDFVQYLDADDLLAPDKIEIQVRRLIEEKNAAIAAGSWGRFQNYPEQATFVPEPFWTDLAPIDWLVSCWQRSSMMHPAAWLTPRPIHEQAGQWDETLSLNDDGEFFCRVILAARSVCFCPEAKSFYRSVPGSLSSSRSYAAWDSALRAAFSETLQLLSRSDGTAVRKACCRHFEEFVYASYPEVPELRRLAWQRVRELGGPIARPQMGPRMRFFSWFIGWKAVKRLYLVASRFRSGK